MTNCRHCRTPVFGADTHPCCDYWMGRHGRTRCLACDTSKAFKRRDVSPAVQFEDTPDTGRIAWQGTTISEQFPWTRPHRGAA